MNHSKMIRVGLLFSLTALMLMIIAACGQAAPQVQTVVETVVVKETVEVEKVVTVEVEKQVEVEAAAECATWPANINCLWLICSMHLVPTPNRRYI